MNTIKDKAFSDKNSVPCTLQASCLEEELSLHPRYVFNLAYHLCNDIDDADDLTQETFLKAFEHLPDFRGEASLRTWGTANISDKTPAKGAVGKNSPILPTPRHKLPIASM